MMYLKLIPSKIVNKGVKGCSPESTMQWSDNFSYKQIQYKTKAMTQKDLEDTYIVAPFKFNPFISILKRVFVSLKTILYPSFSVGQFDKGQRK